MKKVLKKTTNILFLVAIIMAISVNAFAADIDGNLIQDNPNKIVDLNNDGFDDAYRSEIINSLSAKDILIVHETKPLVYFGWYRMSQMTSPGWDLYQRTLDWASNGSVPANTNVILFTYNGTLDPSYSAEMDGIAAYDYLIGTGYNVLEVHPQADIETLPSSYYGNFNLAIYAWVYPRDATNIVNSGIPFITLSAGETDEMGIGTGTTTLHESLSEFYVVNNTNYITQPYPIGSLNFMAPMWTEATEVAGSGIALVVGDPPTCILNLELTYVNNTLTMDFDLETSVPTIWNVWLCFQTTIIPLWSAPIPVIDPPISFPVSVPGFPHLGIIGILTTFTTPQGIICSDWKTVNTGV